MLPNSKKRYFQVASMFAVLGLLSAIYGNSCSGFKMSSGNGSLLSQKLCTGGGNEIVFTPGKETVSVVYGRQVLDNMQACTGVASLSQNTLDEYAARLGSFSEYGFIGDVTPPMLMGIAALATQVCDDLVDQESAANAVPRIFGNIDFSGATQVSSSDVYDVATRMSRACWGREPSSEEISDIQDGVSSISSGAPQNAQALSRLLAISICTSVLASLDGIRM